MISQPSFLRNSRWHRHNRIGIQLNYVIYHFIAGLSAVAGRVAIKLINGFANSLISDKMTLLTATEARCVSDVFMDECFRSINSV